MKQYIDMENYFKKAAMAQMEILDYLRHSGDSVDGSQFCYCCEFIKQSLELMDTKDSDTEEAEADAHSEVDNKTVNKNELLSKIEK